MDVTTPTEIARSATECKEVLDTHALKEHTWIRSAQVDFNFWCSAIKATSFDKSGMDHRLRNYPDARESICNLLDALKTSVEGAVGIYSGTAKELKDNKSEDSADDIPELLDENGEEAPAWEGELEDSDSSQETDEVQSSWTTSEEPPYEESESVEDNSLSNYGSTSTNNSVLEEYISYVRTILDQLTRISLTIRRAGAKYRFERADKALKETEEVKAFCQHLTAVINSGFPDKDAEVLTATEKMIRVYDDSKFSPVKLKLIRANILRRHRIEYFTKARAPRTRSPVEAPKVVQGQKPDKTPAAVDIAPPTSNVSSKVKESQPVTPAAFQVHEAPVEGAPSTYTAAVTATDVGPNFDTTDLSADKTPSRITRMTKIGGSLVYPGCPKPQPNGTLICPYCNDKLPVSYAKNEQSWKAHVAQDILPYSCIMEECSNDDEMYFKADQLLAHMKAKHSSTKWTCNPCSINTKQASESDQSDPQVLIFFDSAESWQAHTEKEHGNLGPAPQRDILTKVSQRQLIGPLECPLCKTEPTEPRTGMDEHILKHLHEFALRALPGDAGPANEKESTTFQVAKVASSASLLSYTKDSWTVNVSTPADKFIRYIIVMEIFEYLESRLERFESEFSEIARTGLRRCRNIMERRFQYHEPNDMLQIYDPPLVNLLDVYHIFSYADKIPQIRDQPHPPSNITLEMEQDILNAALERVFDMNDSGVADIEDFLSLLKRKVKYPIDFPLPSPGRDRVDIEDIAERIDTGLTKDTDLTRHSNKYKNSPMLLGEKFRKPTKDNVELVRQLSLLPNIILTGNDPDKITKTTVDLVNDLKERVEDWSILWVDARSVDSIQKSCVQILETLIETELRDRSGDGISRSGAKALFHYLSWTYEGLWIMVFDGLEAEGAIYLRLENMFPRSCAGTLIISTTDPTTAQLLGLSEVIQLPEADASFDRNRDKYLQLRAHLAALIVSRPTEGPRDIDKDTRNFDYFAKLELEPIQERLVEANLRRRHKFMEAQRHSHLLKDPTTFDRQRLILAANILSSGSTQPTQEDSKSQVSKTASKKKEPKTDIARTPGDTLTTPGTIASVLDTGFKGLQHRGPTGTIVTRFAARPQYPKAKVSNADQPSFKCPCCCQAIPAREAKDSQFRKHLANDLSPYTCIFDNCPTPYKLFVTKKGWNEHFMNAHPPRWQCPYCHGDPPIFTSLAGITTHLHTHHWDDVSNDELADVLSESEIHIMGITKCPLCDSIGPPDSLALVEHVLEHIHDFSLRSLPWPKDPVLNLNKSAGTFNVSVRDFGHIARWVDETSPEQKCLLQLGASDHIPLASTGERSLKELEEDYFSRNDYFLDESSDGRFPSQQSTNAYKLSWAEDVGFIYEDDIREEDVDAINEDDIRAEDVEFINEDDGWAEDVGFIYEDDIREEDVDAINEDDIRAGFTAVGKKDKMKEGLLDPNPADQIDPKDKDDRDKITDASKKNIPPHIEFPPEPEPEPPHNEFWDGWDNWSYKERKKKEKEAIKRSIPPRQEIVEPAPEPEPEPVQVPAPVVKNHEFWSGWDDWSSEEQKMNEKVANAKGVPARQEVVEPTPEPEPEVLEASEAPDPPKNNELLDERDNWSSKDRKRNEKEVMTWGIPPRQELPVNKTAIQKLFGPNPEFSKGTDQEINSDSKPKTKAEFVANVKKAFQGTIAELFFKNNSEFIEELAEKAAALADDPTTPICGKDLFPKTAQVTMHQQVLYCDDSGSMRREGRWDSQNKLINRIARVTTHILPEGEGVYMRYINQQIPNSNSLKFEDLAEVIMPLTCGGDTPIGTNLKTKVLEPLVYNKLPNNLKRPVLVFIITDGMPEPEPKSTFVDTIVECGNRLEEANFPRESVKFVIGQVGSAKRATEFLQDISNEKRISDVIFVASERLDVTASELETDWKMDEWLIETLYSPIMKSEIKKVK